MKMYFLSSRVILIMCLFALTIKCKERDSCNIGSSPINPIGNIELENVSLIKINKGGQVYEIRDREKLKLIIEKLKKSHIKQIKFGSKDTFKIYDHNHNVLIECFFRDDIFKLKGVVYQTNHIIWECP